MECSICGVSKDRQRLFDAISPKGITRVCENCAYKANLTIIKKPTTFQLKEAEKRKTVYERLSSAAGVDPEKADFSNPIKGIIKKPEEITLKDLVDKNFNKGLAKESKPRPDLFENFHWIVMRARRSKKLTQEQLAKELQESEAAIKMVEKGVLPENDNLLISKLESFLGIKISKKRIEKDELKYESKFGQKLELEPVKSIVELQIKEEELFEPVDVFGEEEEELKKIAERAERFKKTKEITEIEEDPEDAIDFSSVSTRSLSIEDLKAMKKAKEENPFKEDLIKKNDLSEEEMNNIIFGKKV